jgi:hypothetical protein
VRYAWLAVLAALLAPAPALAQSADAGPGDEAGDQSSGAAPGTPGQGAQGDEGGGGDELPPMFREPRKLSGVARGEAQDPPGRLTVRAVQGAMQKSEFGDIRSVFPPGGKVHLVGIASSGAVTVKTALLDRTGRAVFDRVKTGSSSSYVVLAVFPREGAEDRLISKVMAMPPQIGMRMILAGEGTDSKLPAVDDLGGMGAGEGEARIPAPEAGSVVVHLIGQTKDVQEVELFEAGGATPIQKAKVEVVTSAGRLDGQVSAPADDEALRPGLLEVLVERRGRGMADIPVEVGSVARKTDANGRAVFDRLPGGKKLVARASVQGRTFESQPFDAPSKTGQRVRVGVDWHEEKELQARFTGVASSADKVYIARAAGQSRPFLTLPFQMTSTMGAGLSLIIAPPVLMAFHGGAQLDDDTLYFQLQIALYNPSFVPYEAGPQGLRIPLPKGYVGASIEDEVGGAATPLKVDEDRGLVWRGPLPSGQRQFIAGFALPAVDGKTSLSMALPIGLWQSQLVFEEFPGIKIQAPAGARESKSRTEDGRPLLMYQGIQASPGGTLKMSFTGLPQHSVWQKRLTYAVALVVLALIGWAVWGVAMRGRRGGGRQSSLEEEREELLEAVVRLEGELRRQQVTEPVYQQRRGDLLRELEGVYADLAAEREAEQRRAESRASS